MQTSACKPVLLGLACAASFFLVACATSEATPKPPKDVFQTTYRDPDAQPMHVRGAKVVAAVMIKDPKARQRAEDTLAQEITKLGGQGVPMYSISAESVATKEGESKTRALVEAVGATGLVVMRPVDVNHATAATLSNSSNDMYGGYWGGYYGIGWADPWVDKAPDTRVDIVITVETLVFSLPQNKLVWTGTSQSTNPKNAEKLVHQLAVEGTEELKRQGLLVP